MRASEGRQRLDRFARLPLRQAQGGVAGDGAASVEDFGDAVSGNVEPARQFGGAHLQLAQFLGQVFAGMDVFGWHNAILNAARQRVRQEAGPSTSLPSVATLRMTSSCEAGLWIEARIFQGSS